MFNLPAARRVGAAEREGDDPGEDDPRPVCLTYLQRVERQTTEGESDDPVEDDPRPV